MELSNLLKKYRELASLTQSMIADEIYSNCGIKPTIGVINSIERGGAITNKELCDYLYRQFYFVDPQKNDKFVTLSYNIADYCIKNQVELDYIRLFSCITLSDVRTYIDSFYQIKDEEEDVLMLMSEVVEIKYDQTLMKYLVINDTAIFVYNLCFWYFLLSNNEEVEMTKDYYSSKDFVKIADAFGFHEFSTTSEKAKGKIAKTIAKRISLFSHYFNLLDKIDFSSYYDDEYYKSFANLLKIVSGEDVLLDETTLKRQTCDDMVSLIQCSDEDYDEDIVLKIVSNIYKIKDILFSVYSLYQGVLAFPSKKYIKEICDKFETQKIYDFNPKMRDRVDSLVNEFYGIMDDYSEKMAGVDEDAILFTTVRIFEIQKTLFDVFKYNYVIKSKLDELG